MIETLGEISTSMISLFNIPLILNIKRRRCSCDISLLWAIGIWVCSFLLLIASIISGSLTFKMIAVTNLIVFTIATAYIFRYHHTSNLGKAHEYIGRQLHNLGEKAVVEIDGKRSFFTFLE